MMDPHLPALLERSRAALQAASADLIALRRDLHAHPEVSRGEVETTRKLAARLEALGLEVKVRPEGMGLFADLARPGFDPAVHRTVAVRADIDALAVLEQTGLPYASTRPGVMHACGHDVHTTCAMGVAQALAPLREQLPGRLRLFFQHAEEVAPGGALDLIAFGALEGVDAVLGLHVDPELPVGTVGVKVGALTASVDAFKVVVRGRSGHGARPHHAVDPIFISAQLVQELYRAPAHHFDVRDPVVISVGSIHGGQACNVIPEEVVLEGTFRTLSRAHRERVGPLIQRLAEGLAAVHGATCEVTLRHGSPSIQNDPAITSVVAGVAAEVVGPSHVRTLALPSMGAEDFSEYLEHVPGMMFRLGVWDGGPQHFLHSGRFAPHEDAIPIGARVLAESALRLMAR